MTDPIHMDKVMAAKLVSAGYSHGKPPQGWERAPDEQNAASDFHHTASAFDGAVFVNRAEKVAAVAFMGVQDGLDAIAAAALASDFQVNDETIAWAKKHVLKHIGAGRRVEFVAHSLGGYNAQRIFLALSKDEGLLDAIQKEFQLTKRPELKDYASITAWNPAGAGGKTKDSRDRALLASVTRINVTQGDVVSTLQPLLGSIDVWRPQPGLSALDLHSVAAVLENKIDFSGPVSHGVQSTGAVNFAELLVQTAKLDPKNPPAGLEIFEKFMFMAGALLSAASVSDELAAEFQAGFNVIAAFVGDALPKAKTDQVADWLQELVNTTRQTPGTATNTFTAVVGAILMGAEHDENIENKVLRAKLPGGFVFEFDISSSTDFTYTLPDGRTGNFDTGRSEAGDLQIVADNADGTFQVMATHDEQLEAWYVEPEGSYAVWKSDGAESELVLANVDDVPVTIQFEASDNSHGAPVVRFVDTGFHVHLDDAFHVEYDTTKADVVVVGPNGTEHKVYFNDKVSHDADGIVSIVTDNPHATITRELHPGGFWTRDDGAGNRETHFPADPGDRFTVRTIWERENGEVEQRFWDGRGKVYERSDPADPSSDLVKAADVVYHGTSSARTYKDGRREFIGPGGLDFPDAAPSPFDESTLEEGVKLYYNHWEIPNEQLHEFRPSWFRSISPADPGPYEWAPPGSPDFDYKARRAQYDPALDHDNPFMRSYHQAMRILEHQKKLPPELRPEPKKYEWAPPGSADFALYARRGEYDPAFDHPKKWVRDHIFHQRKMEHERAFDPWLYEEDQKKKAAEEARREEEAGLTEASSKAPEPAGEAGEIPKATGAVSEPSTAPAPAPERHEQDFGDGAETPGEEPEFR